MDLFDVHNNKLAILGKITLPIQFNSTTLTQEFIITNGIIESCILGADAIFSHGFIVDGENRLIYLARDGPGQALSIETTTKSVKKLNISSMNSAICQVKVIGFDLQKNTTYMFLPSKDLPKEISIEPFVGTLEKNSDKIPVLMTNNSMDNILIPRNTFIGTMEFPESIIGSVNLKAETLKIILDDSPENLKLPNETKSIYKDTLQNLLEDFKDLFATKDSELGSTGLIKHTIDTQGKGPIRLRPYRAPQKQKEEMVKQIKEMLDNKVIQQSTSP